MIDTLVNEIVSLNNPFSMIFNVPFGFVPMDKSPSQERTYWPLSEILVTAIRSGNMVIPQSFVCSSLMEPGKLEAVTYTLEREAEIDDICIKLNGWRSRSYPLEIFAGQTMIWSGNTEKSFGYIHLHPEKPVRSDKIMIRLKGSTTKVNTTCALLK